MKKILTSIFVVIMVYWSSVFGGNLTDIEKYFNEMLSFQLNFEEEGDRLSGFIRDISKRLVEKPKDPYLWYLKGRSSLALVYVLDKKDSQYETVRNRVAAEYEKALELNKEKPSLSSKVLSHIFTFPTVASIGVEATRQYITLEQKEDRLQQKEHLELLRDRVVGGLIRQNKFEEALKELDYIDEYFPDNAEGETGNNVWRLYYAEEIEKQKAKLVADKPVEEETKSEPEPEKKPEVEAEVEVSAEPTTVVPDPEPTTTAPVSPSAESPPLSEDANLKWYLLLVVVPVFAFVIAMRRRKQAS